MDGTSSGVSVLICSYNGAERLPRTLECLGAQACPEGFPWEVILVDNASTDGTAQVAEKAWQGPAPLRIVSEMRPGKGNALMRGMQEARFGIVSILDDDNWPDPDWLATVDRVFREHPEVGICGGKNRPVCEIEPPEWFTAYQEHYAVGAQGLISGDVTDTRGRVWGAGSSFRRQALQQLFGQGFSLRLAGRQGHGLNSGEDTELCLAMRWAGWRIWYEETLRLSHFIPAGRLTWPYLCGLYRGFGSSWPILNVYSSFLSDPPGTPGRPSLPQKIKAALSRLMRIAAFLARAGKAEGSRADLDVAFCMGLLDRLVRLNIGLIGIRKDLRSLARRIAQAR